MAINPAVMFAAIGSSNSQLDDDTNIIKDNFDKIIEAGLLPLVFPVQYTLMNNNQFEIRNKAERFINTYNESSNRSLNDNTYLCLFAEH